MSVPRLLPSLSLLASLMLLGACALPTAQRAPADDAAPLQAHADARWFALPAEPFKGKQDDVFFVDAQLGFYVNGQGKIFRSRDAGQHWELVLHKPGTYFRTIAMLDARHGFAGNIGTDYFPGVTDETPLYETHDGGDSWTPVLGLPGAAIKGICAIDVLRARFINAGVLDERSIVHAGGRVGSPAQLLRSLDAGKSWQQIDMSPWVAMIVDVKFFDAMNGVVFAGSDADIEKSHALIVATHDGGKTWEKVYESQRPFELTWKGSFPSRQVGYATIQNYNPDKTEEQRYIVKTSDGGKTWHEMPLVKDFAVREFGVGFANEQLGWVGTNKSGYETRDGGRSWQPIEMGRAVNKIRILPVGERGFVAHAIGSSVYRFDVPPASIKAAPEPVPVVVGKP